MYVRYLDMCVEYFDMRVQYLVKYVRYLDMTAYLLFSTFRSNKYCEWIVNKYVIFFDNDCMILGIESLGNKLNKIKQCYIVV